MQYFIPILFILFNFLSQLNSRKGVFVGGGLDDNSEIYQKFIDLSTISSNLRLGIITGASSPEESESNGQFYMNIFKNFFNVSAVEWLPIDLNHPANAFNQTIVNTVANMTGIFFGGGDQARLIQLLLLNDTIPYSDTPVLAKIREKYEAGLLTIGGSSAGTTIMQKTPMVSGGQSYNALVNGSHQNWEPHYYDDLSYEIRGGFGFFDWGYLDTHFGTRGRQGRIIRLAFDMMNSKTSEDALIFGINENTALKIDGDQALITGETGVFMINIANAKKTPKVNNGMENIKVNYLTEGDIIDLKTNQVTFADWKGNIRGKEEHDYPFKISYDIFSSPNNDDEVNNTRINPREFIRITTDLFNSALSQYTEAYSFETEPSFKLTFRKTEDSIGVVGKRHDIEYISYVNLNLCINSSTLIKENE